MPLRVLLVDKAFVALEQSYSVFNNGPVTWRSCDTWTN